MENQPLSTTSEQIFSDEQPDNFKSQTPSDHAVSGSLTDLAPSSEVSQAPFISHLIDPQIYAVRGFILSCVGLAAWFVSFLIYCYILFTFFASAFLQISSPFILTGTIGTAFISSVCGVGFSIRGLQSSSKKGLAIAGLILSIIPLLISLILLILYVVVAIQLLSA